MSAGPWHETLMMQRTFVLSRFHFLLPHPAFHQFKVNSRHLLQLKTAQSCKSGCHWHIGDSPCQTPVWSLPTASCCIKQHRRQNRTQWNTTIQSPQPGVESSQHHLLKPSLQEGPEPPLSCVPTPNSIFFCCNKYALAPFTCLFFTFWYCPSCKELGVAHSLPLFSQPPMRWVRLRDSDFPPR